MKTDEFKVIISVDADDAKKDIKDVKEETKELGKDGKKSMGEFDQAVADAKASISNSMKVVGVSIAAAATALVAISESTKEFRANQAKLNAAFESAGGSAKEAAQAYDGLYRVLGDDGQATEAAQHLAQLTTNQEDLAEWTDICQGVYATFGDSLPIESLTEASNETAKTGKITGALADALNWAGISEEQFQAELDKCVDASEREQKIRSTLNKTYKTASANYEKTAKDTLKANDAQNKMNKSLAKIGELIQPLITDFLEIGASILDGLQEPLEAAVGFIKDFVIPAIKGIVDFVKNNEGIILGAMAGITGAMITYKAAVLLAKGAEEGITIATMARTAAQKALNIVMNANPIGLATAAIVGITTAVVAYTTAADNAKESTTVLTQEQLELRDAVFEAAEAARTQREESQKAIGEIQSQSAYHKRLADELFKLADANGVVAESDRTRAQFIINQLNEAYGLEIEMIDGVIQNNSKLKDSIYEVIQAETAQAMLDEYKDDYIAAQKAMFDAKQAMIDAQYDYIAAQEEIREEEEKIIAERDAYIAKHKDQLDTMSAREQQAYQGTINRYNSELSHLRTNMYEKERAYGQATKVFGEHLATVTTFENAYTEAQEGNYETAMEILSGKSGAYFKYSGDVAQATQEAVDSLFDEALKAGIAADDTKRAFEDGVEGYTLEMVYEAEKGYADALREWAGAYNDAHEVGTDLGGGLKAGLEGTESGLLDRASSMIANVIAEMRYAAQSHSPSRKTMSLGNDLGDGAEIGINQTTKNVAKAAKNMIDSSIKPIETAIKDVQAKDFSSIFDTSSFGANVSMTNRTVATIEGGALDTIANKLLQSNDRAIILQVDGKTFAETSISTINQLTRQSGTLALDIR